MKDAYLAQKAMFENWQYSIQQKFLLHNLGIQRLALNSERIIINNTSLSLEDVNTKNIGKQFSFK